jgi:hypothetical protein
MAHRRSAALLFATRPRATVEERKLTDDGLIALWM